jgi:transcriptional regulator with XRE-family HTH domain
MKLGELMAIARECKGWTLRDLERESGVSNALISQIETGKVKDPGFGTVVRLARCLGVSVDRCAATVFHYRDALRKARPISAGKSPKC